MDNVRRIYILINWLELKGLKCDSLIWVLDVFAIAFRIYPKGPLIISNELFVARAEITWALLSRQSDTNFAISLMLFLAGLIS